MYKRVIFWFRQDLRTYDNYGFIEAIKNSKEILPIFILDKNITADFGDLKDKKFWFIREALENLDAQIKKLWGRNLNIFHDTPEKIIPFLVEKYKIEAVYTNRSYGLYGTWRDALIEKILKKKNVAFYKKQDFLLIEPEEIQSYKVFTPYKRKWFQVFEEKYLKKEEDSLIYEKKADKITTIEVKQAWIAKDFIPTKKHPYFTLNFWKQRLKKGIRKDYEEKRNFLAKDGTSRLSPYLRFWIFSIRQIYNEAVIAYWYANNPFVSELIWREFWQHIAYYFPETKQKEFQEKRRHIAWNKNEELFEKWCKWETGYPIIDASMKQLTKTNLLHGRARMIVASFLTKDLHIDWRWGEKFFKKHLLDYDENMNFGNWQWSASVWADPKPLRIFNPSLQSEKFDSEAKFIRHYIPTLKNDPIDFIHFPLKHELSYIPPIVDHSQEQSLTRSIYKGDMF